MFGASKFAIDPCRRHPGFNDVGSVIGAVAGPIIGGIFGNSAANQQVAATQQASAASTAASQESVALARQALAQQQANQQPWLNAGSNALSQLSAGTSGPNAAFLKPFSMADYQADPGYSFRQTQGMNALQNSAAARGGLLSGNTLKGIQDYSQGLASQEYQNAYSRYTGSQNQQYNALAGIAGTGQTAANNLGSAQQNFANNASTIIGNNAANQGNAALAAGQARASSMQGMGTALGGVNWGKVFG